MGCELAGGSRFPPRIGPENPEPRRLRLGGLSNECSPRFFGESCRHLPALARICLRLRAGDPPSRTPGRTGLAGVPPSGFHFGSHGELRAWHRDVLRLLRRHIPGGAVPAMDRPPPQPAPPRPRLYRDRSHPAAGVILDKVSRLFENISMTPMLLDTRELSENTARVLRDLPKSGPRVITKGSETIGILIPPSPSGIKSDIDLLERLRLGQALAAVQRDAIMNETNSFSMQAIDAEIRAARVAKRKRKK